MTALDENGAGQRRKKTLKTAAAGSAQTRTTLDIPLERGSSFIEELLVRLDANGWYPAHSDR